MPHIQSVKPFIHDPCIAQEGRWYYVYSTGSGIPVRRSEDLIHWEVIGRVFAEDVPAWAAAAVPGSKGIWAPDISYVEGRYHLYYSVSTFGSNRSVIGLATNTTLDPGSPDYRWVDAGLVVESQIEDDFNAIDPNLVFVQPKQIALCFGSFWSGIKLIPLDARTGKPPEGAARTSLAQRPAPDALEAPFIVWRDPFYYLFVSFDYCCRGLNSTYHIRVGRAREATGPYLDQTGHAMLKGGGTLLLASEGNVIGPGGCSVLQSVEGDWLVHHFYDGARDGAATLQARPLCWTPEGWPVTGAPLPSGDAWHFNA